MTELELCLPPEDAAALLRSAVVSVRGRAVVSDIVWHDTAAHSFEQEGLLLARHGRAARMERLRPDPDAPAAWPPAGPAPCAPAGPIAGLQPVAMFRGSDREMSVAIGDAAATLRLSVGELQGIAARRPVARALLVGERQALRALLPVLAEAARLRVPRAGLAADALALAQGGRPAPRWLGAPHVPPGLPVTDMVAVAVGQLTDVILHWSDIAGTGESCEPVHQLRVALRRLRAALSVFRPVAGCAETEWLTHQLRDISAVLGEARDWDVFLAELGPAVAECCGADPRLTALLAAARRKRAAAYQAVGSALAGSGFRQIELALATAACLRPWEWDADADPARLAADPGDVSRAALDRRLRRVLRGGRRLSDLPDPDLHQVRKDCKKLRYAAELFAPLYAGRGVRRFTKRLAVLQEALGAVNDGAVATDLLAGLGRGGRGFAAGAVRGFVAARSRNSRQAARRAFRDFRAVAPFWIEPSA